MQEEEGRRDCSSAATVASVAPEPPAPPVVPSAAVSAAVPTGPKLGDVKRYPEKEKKGDEAAVKILEANVKVFNEADTKTQEVATLPKDLIVVRLSTLDQDGFTLVDFPSGIGQFSPGWVESKFIEAKGASTTREEVLSQTKTASVSASAKPASSAAPATSSSAKPAASASASASAKPAASAAPSASASAKPAASASAKPATSAAPAASEEPKKKKKRRRKPRRRSSFRRVLAGYLDVARQKHPERRSSSHSRCLTFRGPGRFLEITARGPAPRNSGRIRLCARGGLDPEAPRHRVRRSDPAVGHDHRDDPDDVERDPDRERDALRGVESAEQVLAHEVHHQLEKARPHAEPVGGHGLRLPALEVGGSHVRELLGEAMPDVELAHGEQSAEDERE